MCADVIENGPNQLARDGAVIRLFDGPGLTLTYVPGQGLWSNEQVSGATVLYPEPQVVKVYWR